MSHINQGFSFFLNIIKINFSLLFYCQSLKNKNITFTDASMIL